MRIFWVALLLLLMPLAYAELVITPNPFSGDVLINEQKTFQVTFTNSFDFRILGFSFENMSGFSIPDIDLAARQEKTYNISAMFTNVTSYNIVSKVTFKYYVDIPQGARSYNISIDSSGYHPNNLTIRQGDSVQWKNNDTISHTVTSGMFDVPLQPNETMTRTFNDITVMNYQDLNTFFGATLNVVNRSTQELVNNPSYDKLWSVNINSMARNTTLDVSLGAYSYNVSSNGSVDGMMQLKNIGNNTARDVILSTIPDWIRYDKNDITLLPNEISYVIFHVQPAIFEKTATNKTYNLNLHIKAINTEDYSKNVSVYVPLNDEIATIDSSEGFLVFFLNYCQSHPNLLICNNTVSQQNQQQQIIIRDPDIPINLSSREVLAMLRRQQQEADSIERTNNMLKSYIDSTDSALQEMRMLLNSSITMAQKAQEDSDNRTRAVWIIGFFMVIIGGIVGTGVFYWRYNKRRTTVSMGMGR